MPDEEERAGAARCYHGELERRGGEGWGERVTEDDGKKEVGCEGEREKERDGCVCVWRGGGETGERERETEGEWGEGKERREGGVCVWGGGGETERQRERDRE